MPLNPNVFWEIYKQKMTPSYVNKIQGLYDQWRILTCCCKLKMIKTTDVCLPPWMATCISTGRLKGFWGCDLLPTAFERLKPTRWWQWKMLIFNIKDAIPIRSRRSPHMLGRIKEELDIFSWCSSYKVLGTLAYWQVSNCGVWGWAALLWQGSPIWGENSGKVHWLII